MTRDELMRGLPGESLVRRGLDDLSAGRASAHAYLVAIAATRLRNAGLLPGDSPIEVDEPELMLYRLLRREGGDAYARYNALVRELVSFESALDARLRRTAQEQGDARPSS